MLLCGYVFFLCLHVIFVFLRNKQEQKSYEDIKAEIMASGGDDE